jgi:amino acid transporter
VISAGAIFIAVSAAHLAYPDWQSLIPHQDTASLIISEHVGERMYNFFMATYLTGVYASAMTAQTSVSRIFYAMGEKAYYHAKCSSICIANSTHRGGPFCSLPPSRCWPCSLT